MKKSILTLGLFLIAAVAVQSATVVTGSLYDATWNKDGSPYQLQGAVVIPAGSTIKAGPGVQVEFAPGSSLEVRGTLHVDGQAVYPSQFRIPTGGYLLVKGGEMTAVDAKFVGGYFVVDDGKVEVTACEITGGSGPYLRGATTAVFRSNKIYGNSCGFTLDGEQVDAKFIFNTLVMNTYGLHLKKYSMLSLENNSIHDNTQFQVVNDLAAPAVLGDNFWGTETAAAVPVRGVVKLEPLKSMKDVLREYVMTQLPNLPSKKMAQVVKRAKAEKATSAAAAKKAAELRKSQALADAKAAKAKALAEKRAAKRKELADKKAAEKAALEAKLKEVAPVETPAAAAPAAQPAAPFGELETNTAAPAPAAEAVVAPAAPAVPVADAASPAVTAPPAAPAATDAALGAPAAPSTAMPDLPGLVAPPDAAAPAAPAATTAAPAVDTTTAVPATAPAATAAAPALPAATTPAAPATGAPAIPAGGDSFNANMIPAPPATAATSSAPPDLNGLDLPPLNDKPIQAPKDMDLPPLDDLGVPPMDATK